MWCYSSVVWWSLLDDQPTWYHLSDDQSMWCYDSTVWWLLLDNKSTWHHLSDDKSMWCYDSTVWCLLLDNQFNWCHLDNRFFRASDVIFGCLAKVFLFCRKSDLVVVKHSHKVNAKSWHRKNRKQDAEGERQKEQSRYDRFLWLPIDLNQKMTLIWCFMLSIASAISRFEWLCLQVLVQ